MTSAWTTFGLWGPKARDILGHLTGDDISNAGFPFGTCRDIEAEGMTVLASRISYVGELGWELHVPIEQGAKLWDALFSAGLAYGMVPAGIGVYGTTGRLEKGYRAYGAELDASYNLVEAGMTRPKVKEQDFVGKTAYLRQRADAAGRGAVHADGGRPRVRVRRAAVHARRRARAVGRRRAADRRAGAGGRTSPARAPGRRSASTC